MLRVEILLFNGFDELDVVAPFEILVSAGLGAELVTVEHQSKVVGAHGMALTPDKVLGSRPELLVVPGGGWVSRGPQGVWAEIGRGVLPAAIAERHAAGSRIAGVCSGVMLLAAGELLRGRRAVSHRTALDAMRDYGAQVIADARVVDDGDILTCGGVTSAIDLALYIVEQELGRDAAMREATRIEHDVPAAVVYPSAVRES